MKAIRTVRELKKFLAVLPEDLGVRGYEGEDTGVAFDNPPERDKYGYGEDIVAWFSSTDAGRDSLPNGSQ